MTSKTTNKFSPEVRGRLPRGGDRHDRVKAFGQPIAPAAREILVEPSIEQRHQEHRHDDDDADPSIGAQMAGMTQLGDKLGDTPAGVFTHHDALARSLGLNPPQRLWQQAFESA